MTEIVQTSENKEGILLGEKINNHVCKDCDTTGKIYHDLVKLVREWKTQKEQTFKLENVEMRCA